MSDFMLQEIKEQPAILHHLTKHHSTITEIVDQIDSVTRIYLTGCGDPYFAALTSRYYIEKATGLPTLAIPSMDFRWLRNTLPVGSVVIASSVSGRTNRTIEAAKAAKETGALTIGITDNTEGPLTSYCDFVIPTRTSPPETLNQHEYAGYQYVVPQTKTYSAVLLTQMTLGFFMATKTRENHSTAGQSLNDVGQAVQNSLETLEQPLQELGAKYAEQQNVAILGSGPFFGLAKYGGAKFLEFAIPCYSQCLEEFNHQEVFLADERWLVVLLAPDYLSSHRARELAPLYGELGVQSLLIGAEPYTGAEPVDSVTIGKYPELIAPFVYTLPLQLLSFFMAKAKGRAVDEWCGGKRTEQMIKLSQKTIRASEII